MVKYDIKRYIELANARSTIPLGREGLQGLGLDV
jgi:hypothetical protein